MMRGLRLLLVLATLWVTAAPAQLIELNQARATVQVGDSVSVGTQTLPYHWDRLHHARGGHGDFELFFVIDTPPAQPWGAFFPRLGNSYRVWLNGYLLAEAGDPAQANGEDHAKSASYVPIPSGLLERDNLLRVEIRADDGRRGGLSTVTLGPAAEVLPLYESSRLWRVDASLAITVFSLLVALIALVLWLTQQDATPGAQRRDNTYLWAALAELSWALRVGDVAIVDPPLAWPVWGVVVTAAFAGWICCTALFCHHVAGWQHGQGMRWLRRAVLALFLASLAASAASLWTRQPLYLTAWLGLANLCFVAYAVVYFAAAMRHPDTSRVLVAIAGGLNLLMGIRDWVTVRISGNLADNTWIRYSSVLFGIALGYIVVTRFREASAQAREFRHTLEERVRQKEVQLQDSYQRVEQLALERERAAERARILRDMHDGVGSHISSAIRQLQSGRADADEVLRTLRDSLDQLKLSIDSMNLPPGDLTALLANLRYRLEPRLAASDIELQWDVDWIEPLPGLDAHAMRQLQFMLFEALSNVLQHAQARTLRVQARASGPVLRVIDDGIGFDVHAPRRRGLLTMQERAAAIGARLHIDSAPGRTCVEIAFG